MSLMTKGRRRRSFRHWHKALRQSITKLTKQHIVVLVIIAVAAQQIVEQQRKENSKPHISSRGVANTFTACY
jgi:hypothetical protein